MKWTWFHKFSAAPPPPMTPEEVCAEQERRHAIRNSLNVQRLHLLELSHRANDLRQQVAAGIISAQIENEIREHP